MMLMDGITILTGDYHYVLCGANVFGIFSILYSNFYLGSDSCISQIEIGIKSIRK